MTIKDRQGFELSGASAQAADRYQCAITAYHCYIDEAIEHVEAAIADSPEFVMAHVLKAWMLLLGGDSALQMEGASALLTARELPAGTREQGHLGALDSLAAGEISGAGRILEDVAITFPRDSLALFAGQLCDFLTGDSRMLRDRVARALPAWSASDPDYHALLGMHAFGLEETGQYARAEAAGREAVALQPRNNWAQHAVAHVLEMQDRREEGLRWMTAENTAWAPGSDMAVHNWWHVALFHLGLGQIDDVLALYDGLIFGQPSSLPFDLADAAAILWRLHLRGIDVGERWTAVADACEHEPRGGYAFNDAHAMMAYVGAGRQDAARWVLEAQATALQGPGDNARFVSEVGLAVIEALHAFGQGDYARTVERLRGVRHRTHRFGGSHAQRDVFDLTLIEAARRDGQSELAAALLAERRDARPQAAALPGRIAA